MGPLPITGVANPVTLGAQRGYWDGAYARYGEMFGTDPSAPARAAADLFLREGRRDVLELGAGYGRDTLFFASRGLRIRALDYSSEGAEAMQAKVRAKGLTGSIDLAVCDVRDGLPFPIGSIDACYSHMLFCMALTTAELEALAQEVRRVLRPGGLCIYTVRTKHDAHFGAGTHRGEDMYGVGGFIVHFFDRDLVDRLARDFALVDVTEFEEGELPRKLFRVTMRKQSEGGETS